MEQGRENLSAKEISRILSENERLRKENFELRRQLTYDSITGLLRTQNEGRRRILEKINIVHDEGKKIGLIRLDVNNLKPWNKKYGHDETDEILGLFGKELQSWSEARGGLAMRFHFKGDEFGILLPLANKDKLAEVVQKLGDFSLEHLEESVTCSFTIGFVHEDEPDVKEEMKKLQKKENSLSEAGRLFTALSKVADNREREQEKKKER